MRILQLCHKTPFPPRDGGSIAMNNLTQGLIKLGNEVQVLAINTPNNYINISTLDNNYREQTNIQAVYKDTSIKISSALYNLFSNKSYNIERFISKDFENLLTQFLSENEYDIVQLESLFVAPYLGLIRKMSDAKIVLRAHNVEFEIWHRRYLACKTPLKKNYLKLLARRLKSYEINLLNQYDAIVSITSRDTKILKDLGCELPIVDIPVGIDRDKFETSDPNVSPVPISLFHLGSMDWMPNMEAIEWFLRDIWEEVKISVPGIKLHLAGKNMPEQLLQQKDKDIHVEGEITNALDYMGEKGIMIVPLLSGSGMRVKIIEGMALGKMIISTSIGAEGIEYENGKNILIANTPKEFVQMINKAANNPTYCQSVGKEAKELVKSKYDNDGISLKLLDFFHSIS